MKLTKDSRDALLSIFIEIVPLFVFIFFNENFGFLWATICLIVTTPFAAYVGYRIKKDIPYISIFSIIFVTIFGILAIIFRDEKFLTLKPTIVYILIAISLFLSLILRINIIKIVFSRKVDLPMKVWRNLTLYWALFFLFNSFLNEFVRRNTTIEQWFWFKAVVFVPEVAVFSIIIGKWLYPYLKHTDDKESASK